MTDPGKFYKDFVELTDELYPYCTLTEKLTVYVQHRPGSVVPFLEELIRELHPPKEENDEQAERSD